MFSNKGSGAAPIFPSLIVTKLPIVKFDYPDSSNEKMKTRYVRVAEANEDYVKGNELETPGSKKDGPFKSFSRNRMAKDSVVLISY